MAALMERLYRKKCRMKIAFKKICNFSAKIPGTDAPTGD